MIRSSLFLLILSLLAGCGGSTNPKPVPVSGTVSWKGQPVPDGYLTFKTLDSGGEQTAVITHGSYRLQILPGRCRVEIYAMQVLEAQAASAAMRAPPRANYLPARYNTASTLVAEVQAKDRNVIDFLLDGPP